MAQKNHHSYILRLACDATKSICIYFTSHLACGADRDWANKTSHLNSEFISFGFFDISFKIVLFTRYSAKYLDETDELIPSAKQNHTTPGIQTKRFSMVFDNFFALFVYELWVVFLHDFKIYLKFRMVRESIWYNKNYVLIHLHDQLVSNASNSSLLSETKQNPKQLDDKYV